MLSPKIRRYWNIVHIQTRVEILVLLESLAQFPETSIRTGFHPHRPDSSNIHYESLMGLHCMPETGVISDFANIGCFILLYLCAHTCKGRISLTLEILTCGKWIIFICTIITGETAFAVDIKSSKSCIALYHYLIISENNPGNDDEAKHTEIEGNL